MLLALGPYPARRGRYGDKRVRKKRLKEAIEEVVSLTQLRAGLSVTNLRQRGLATVDTGGLAMNCAGESEPLGQSQSWRLPKGVVPTALLTIAYGQVMVSFLT
jgi:hypothetical protein